MSYRFPGTDSAFAFYVHERSSQCSSPGHETVREIGILYGSICAKCHRKGPWAVQHGKERCKRCGDLRPTVQFALPHHHAPARGELDHSELMGALGLAFRDLTLWQHRPYMVYVLEGHGDRARALAACRDLWPRRSGGWSRAQFEALVDGARARSHRGLRRQQLVPRTSTRRSATLSDSVTAQTG